MGFGQVMEERTMTVETKAECQVVRPGGTYDGKQGFSYFEGIARESVGASGICMHLLTMPPGARAKAHMHESHETAIYCLSGEVDTGQGIDRTIGRLEGQAKAAGGNDGIGHGWIGHAVHLSAPRAARFPEDCMAVSGIAIGIVFIKSLVTGFLWEWGSGRSWRRGR